MGIINVMFKRTFKISEIHHRKKERWNEDGRECQINKKLKKIHLCFMKVSKVLFSEMTTNVS